MSHPVLTLQSSGVSSALPTVHWKHRLDRFTEIHGVYYGGCARGAEVVFYSANGKDLGFIIFTRHPALPPAEISKMYVPQLYSFEKIAGEMLDVVEGSCAGRKITLPAKSGAEFAFAKKRGYRADAGGLDRVRTPMTKRV